MPLLVVFFGLAVGAGLVVNQLLPGWPTLALVGALVAMAFLAFLFNDSPTLRSNSATRDADLERLERRIAEVSMTIRLLRELQN